MRVGLERTTVHQKSDINATELSKTNVVQSFKPECRNEACIKDDIALTLNERNQHMNKNNLLFAVVLLLTSTVTASAQLREYPDESLKGLIGVRVIVNYKGPVEESYGLSQKQLQNTVESRLIADNIKVLNDKQWSREPGNPYFYITVIGTQVGSGTSPTFFYSFATDLIQNVSLGRIPSLKTQGSTWNQDYSLVVSKDSLRDVTIKISDVAHDFAQSVHEANK